MASRFLSGLVVGTVLSGVALAAASLATGGAGRGTAPRPVVLEVPLESEFNRARNDTAARLPQTDAAPGTGGGTSQVDSAKPDDLSAVATDDTRPSARPTLGTIDGDLSAPQIPDEASGMAVSGAEPDQGARALEPQGISDDPAISTDPAQPSLPEIESGVGFSMEEGAHTEASPPSDANGDSARQVETRRLPSAGTQTGANNSATSKTSRAIDTHAAAFDNPDAKPLMSIVLIDAGASPVLLEALEGFPYPLSFAIDATAPGAEGVMRRYRDAGFEVLAIADLPEGADARDTETVMQTVLAAVPEAVGVLEGTGAGLQISRDASEQLGPILRESGHGLVLFSKGLQTAPKLIARAGVPVGTVLRDFDGDSQSAPVIRRFLDQAAFKAGRMEDGGVIMLGRLRADTIGALLLWGMQDRAKQVALAPVSAVLKAEN